MESNTRKMSRRALLKYGTKGSLAAATAIGAAGMFPHIIRNASAAEPKYKLRYGASIINPKNEVHLVSGAYHFADQVRELTGGEVEIQIIDSGQGCNENTCGDRVANGIFDIGMSSAQNLGAVFAYSIALDWPMLWTDRTEYLNFLFSPESNKLYRDVLTARYGVVPLFASGEMRNVMMGKKYEESDEIRSPEKLKGAKIRVTNSAMIAAFAQSMEMNPVPLAFTELLEGLRTGVVDATETWPAAATGFGMADVLAQDVAVGFSPGFELAFISKRKYDQLPDEIKEALLEASYQTMIYGYNGVAEAQKKIVGNVEHPDSSSVYATSGIRHVRLSADELQAFRDVASVQSNEALYQPIRQQLTSVAGFDILEPLQEFQKAFEGKPVTPQRWWK